MSPHAILFISLLLDLLSFTIILPLLPSILDYYALHDKSNWYGHFDQQISAFAGWINSPLSFNKVLFGGLIGSWFSLLQFVAAPFIGAFSDVYGRRGPLLLCLVGIAASYFVWLRSKESFLLFILSRTIGGLSKGNVSLSTAIAADISDEKSRGRAMALVGIAFSIGFMVGPTVGALFAAHSRSSGTNTDEAFFQLPALFALALSLLNIVFVALFFQESLPTKNRVSSLGSGFQKAFDFVNPRSLLTFRPVSNVNDSELNVLCETGWIYFQFLFLFSGLEYTLSFLTHTRFSYTSVQQGKMYLFVGIVMALLQGGFVRRIKSGKESLYALLGISFIVPSFVIIGLAGTIKELYGGLMLYAFSAATTVPCLTTLISMVGPSNQKGVVMGIFRSIGALARAFGPVFASIVFWKYGPAYCYLGGAALMVLPLLNIYRLRRRLTTASTHPSKIKHS